MNAHIAPGSLALLEGQDCRITGNVASFISLLFILLLFIDRFYCVVVWYGLRSEGRGDWLKNEIHKIIVV